MSDQNQTATTGGEVPVRPDRPVRDPDPARNAAYWARIDAIVDQAPPLSNEQKAILRAIFHRPAAAARTTAVTR